MVRIHHGSPDRTQDRSVAHHAPFLRCIDQNGKRGIAMRLATVGIIVFVAALSQASVLAEGPAHVLFDINQTPGQERSSRPQAFAACEGFTLFTANSPATGTEMWRTDGTEAGTFLLADIWPGIFSGVVNFPAECVGNFGYFAAVDPGHGSELWVTDGS